MEPQLYKRKVITKEYYKLLDNGTVALTSWSTNGTNNSSKGTGLYNTVSPIPGWWPLPGQPPVTDPTTFTNSIVNYFDSYGQKMSKMINMTSASEDDLAAAEEDMFKDIEVIGSLVRPYYSAEFAEKLNQLLRAYALGELQVISLTRAGLDTRTWINFRFATILHTDISIMLNTFNNWWNQVTIKQYWVDITSAWHAAVKAKKEKNQAEADRQLLNANNILKTFGDALAQGVIYQHPQYFVQSVAPSPSA
jgi:hypothetical protein